MYAIGLWGDLPYSAIQETTGVPNLIADMNRHDLAFTAHDGDLKAGSNSACDDALYTKSLAYLNALRAPAAFTPGDLDPTPVIGSAFIVLNTCLLIDSACPSHFGGLRT